MAALTGTNVGAPLAQFDSADQFGTHFADRGVGGKFEVANIAARDAIFEQRRTVGMFVTTQDDGKTYQLKGGTANSHWEELTLGGSPGGSDVTLDEVITRDAQTLATAKDYADSKAITVVDELPETLPPGTIVGVRSGNLPEGGGSGRRSAAVVIGTVSAGHTLKDVDFLCDGFTDSQTIMDAINALPASGDRVLMLGGIYNLEKQVAISKSNVTIEGMGTATILRRMYNETGGSGLLDIAANYCSITNLTIHGNRAIYTAIFNHGIRITGSYTRLFGLRIYDTQNCVWDSGDYSVICKCFFQGSISRGVYRNSSNGNISHNAISGSTTGIHLYGATATNNIISSNNIVNATTGIQLQTGASRNMIDGNSVMRGTGLPGDYTADQYTIRLTDTATNNNFVAGNLILGKDAANEGGTGNTLVNNKFN